MRVNAFGVAIITLSLTLFFGVTISEFLTFKDLPESASVVEIELNHAPEIVKIDHETKKINDKPLKNCKPKDENLKYQTLPLKEDEGNYLPIDKDEKVVIPIPANKPEGKSQNSENSAVDHSKKAPNTEKKKPENVSSPILNQNLLHKEICEEQATDEK